MLRCCAVPVAQSLCIFLIFWVWRWRFYGVFHFRVSGTRTRLGFLHLIFRPMLPSFLSRQGAYF